MKKELTCLLTGTAIFLSTLTIQPSFSYGKDNYMERTKEVMGKIGEKFRKRYGNNDDEAAKNIAKDVLESGMGISGAGKMIDEIDKLNKSEGFYKRQRETNERLRKQGRYSLPKWAR